MNKISNILLGLELELQHKTSQWYLTQAPMNSGLVQSGVVTRAALPLLSINPQLQATLPTVLDLFQATLEQK